MMRYTTSLLMLVGCGDCPTFDEIEVTDPKEVASESVIVGIGEAVADFAAWTGREGVCVSEIRVAPEVLGEGYTGQYHGDWIEVEPLEENIEPLVRHELCHALDEREELSWSNRDLFPPESVESDGLHYPTERVRGAEAFARACDNRPDEIAWLDGLGEICGRELVSAQVSYMNEHVYVDFDDDTIAPSGIVPLALERVAVTGLERYEYTWIATPGGDSVWLVHELSSTGWNGLRKFELLQVEASSRSLVATWPGLTADVEPHVLRSSGDPVLVSAGGRTLAWQLDRDDGTWRELSFPALAPDTSVDGTVRDEVVWAMVTPEGASEEALLRYDLATETYAYVELPGDTVSLGMLSSDDDGLIGRAKDSAEEISWLRYQPETGAWSEMARPTTWFGASAVGLGDGRLLARYSSDIAEDEEVEELLEGLAVLDAGGHILLPDGACEEDVASGAADLMMIGGEPWLWEWPNGWSGEPPVEGVVLTRVVLD